MLANFAYKIERKTLQSNPGRYESAEGGRVCLCGPLHPTEQTNNSSHLSGINAVKTLAMALASSLGALLLLTSQASAQSFSFSTNNPDGRMATASRPGPGPGSGANQETESADDFILSIQTFTTSATFTGLLPSGVSLGDVSQVRVEIYRVFPKDSDVDRTSGPPTFSTEQVPTRVNSPSDVEFFDRDSASGNLTFTTTLLAASFTAANSVDTGIHPKPNQTTLGDGPVTGEEVQFNVTFTTPFDLPADHYFFVPLWTDFRPGSHPGILDWYTVLCAVATLVAVSAVPRRRAGPCARPRPRPTASPSPNVNSTPATARPRKCRRDRVIGQVVLLEGAPPTQGFFSRSARMRLGCPLSS